MAGWSVVNYRDSRGRVPIEDYLDTLQIRDRARVLREIELLEEYGLLCGCLTPDICEESCGNCALTRGLTAFVFCTRLL